MIEDFKKELKKLKSEFEEKLKSIRSHRLSLGFLENLEIEIYHQKLPLKSLCLISQLDPLSFRLDPFDPNSLNEIEKSIQQRKQNFTLIKDKSSLIVKFPPLTEEAKKELIKSLTSIKEEIRIRSRNIRDEFIKDLRNKKESGEISEDQFYKTKENIDKEIEKFNNEVDELFAKKEKEILG